MSDKFEVVLYLIADEFGAVIGYMCNYTEALLSARAVSNELVQNTIRVYSPVGQDGKRIKMPKEFFRGVEVNYS